MTLPYSLPSTTRTRWVSALYLAGALALVGAYFLVGDDLAKSILYDCVAGTAAAAVVAGIHLNGRQPLFPWIAFAVGVALEAGGDASYFVQSLAFGEPTGTLSVSDGFYISVYVALTVALISFTSRHSGSRRAARMLLVDSAALFTAAFALFWFLVVDNLFAQIDGLERVMSVAYPTADLLLLSLAARLVFTTGLRLPAYRLLTAGFALMFVSDILWRTLLASGSYSLDAWINGGFLLAYISWGLAALQPSMTQLSAVETRLDDSIPRGRLALLALVSVAIPAVLAVDGGGSRGAVDVSVLVAVAALLPVLVIFRLADAAASIGRLAALAQATSSRMATFLRVSPLPTAVLDAEGRVTLWNHAAEDASGWVEADAVGRLFPLNPVGDGDHIAALRERALGGEELQAEEVELRTRDGESRRMQMWTAPVDDQASRSIVAVFADVTEQSRREEHVRYLATHDALTGVANRAVFEDALARVLGSPEPGGRAGLLFMDVDNFKLVNDVHGHQAGDELLRQIAASIRLAVRPTDVLARLGGDEFAVVVAPCPAGQITGIARRVLDAVRDCRVVRDETVLDATISIGCCELPDGLRYVDAVARADTALYEAKAQGRNRAVSWTQQMSERDPLTGDCNWSAEIKDAIREDRLLVYLQPIVELSTGHVVRYEALSRIVDRGGSVVMPSIFIPAAARLGLMPAIDRHGIRTAFRLLEEDPALRIFVNLDAASFEDDTLLDEIEMALNTSLASGRFGIEITERTSVRDFARASSRLGRLVDLGCSVAIDDFGNGFSSFSHLRQLPAQYVKIGDSFVREIADDTTATVVLEAMVNTAHGLGKQVIAEGVEDTRVAALLQEYRVEFAQGFLFGRPEPWVDVAVREAGAA